MLSKKNLHLFIVIFILLLSCDKKQYDEIKTSEEIIDGLKCERREYLRKGIPVKVLTKLLDGKKLSESWLVEDKNGKYIYYNLQYNQKGDTIVKKYFQTNKGASFYNYDWGYYNYEDGRYEYKQYFPINDSSTINQFKFYKNGVFIADSSSYYTITSKEYKNEITLHSLADDAILLLSEELHDNYDNIDQITKFDTLFPVRPFVWNVPKSWNSKGVIKIIKFRGQPYYSKERKDYLQRISEKDMYLGPPNEIEAVNIINKNKLW